MNADTQYIKGNEGYVAYQVFGDGPLNVVFVSNWMTNLDAMWEEPSLARYMDRLASFARVLCFDKRGSGVSDPVPLAALPTIDQWMDDARIAMDAAGMERAVILGDTEGGTMAMMFAASHPDRTSALVLVNAFARWTRDEDYAIGMPPESMERLVGQFERHWGVTADILNITAPSVASDTRFRRWFTRYQRLSMPRGAATAMYHWVINIDVRSVLPSIRVPTLVVHRADAQHHRVEHGRFLSQHITGAKYVELSGGDTFPFHAGTHTMVLDEIQEFLTGVREAAVHDRILATVLVTDLVGSTELAAKLGDQRWLDLKESHDRIVREYLQRFRGREIDHSGDGFLATFDGPARAVTCAVEMRAAIRELGVDLRAGLHTGEIELRRAGIGGITVHIAARVMATAKNGGILVSRTAKDLLVGCGIEFSRYGVEKLKGVPGKWELWKADDRRVQ